MRKFTIYFVVVFTVFFASCNNNFENSDLKTDNNEDKEKISKSVIHKPVVIDSTDILLFPTGYYLLNKRKVSLDLYSSEMSGNTGNFSNFIFYNTSTKKSNFLSEKEMHIENYNILYDFFKQTGKNYILYFIRNVDFNNDKLIDRNDPLTVYFSQSDGSNFMKILPDNSSFIDYTPHYLSGKIFFRIYIDSNSDKEFTEKDIITLVCFDIRNPEKKWENVFDTEILKQIEDMKN